MKANLLMGVRFAEDPQLKNKLLAHYKQWKTAKYKAYEEQQDERRAQMIRVGMLVGSSREQLEAEIEQTNVFSNVPLDFSEVENFVQEQDCRHYYITQPVITICSRLRTKEPFDLAWLAPVKDGKRQLNYNDGFIRYEKKGTRIVVLAAAQNNERNDAYFQYSFFNMDIENNTQAEYDGPEQADEFMDEPSAQDFDQVSRRRFFQLITFMELAPIEEIFLPAGRKHGTRKSADGLYNEATFPITIVNTSWNRVIRVGTIDVDGHFRLQAWGPLYSYRRLTWISEYQKTGYNVQALKLTKN